MFMLPSGIRQKIILGYYAIVVFLVCCAVLTFIELRHFEKKVIFGEVISDFFDTTLEIRRFEKNYFLYGKTSDYEENLRYLTKAQEILEGNLGGFATIIPSPGTAALANSLVRYRELMERYGESTPRQESAQRTDLENRIREMGKFIVTTAEDMAKTERTDLQAMLNNSRHVLSISIAVFAVLVVVFGQILSQMVVKPLKSLEENVRVIADGRFEKISIESKDREIVSLTNAFNAMLRELEWRQRHLLQAEKLASLGTLLSGVAHELNNPLSNISSSCQILMEENDHADPRYRVELLSQIEDQTDRARNIVRSLLEFSREKDFKKEILPLRKVFEETIRFVKGQVPTRVSITYAVPEDVVIFADKQRIQQAFLNLLKNAIEAVGEEGEITIRSKKHKAIHKAEETAEIYNYLKYRGKCTLECDTVDIEIRDTGPGIPQEILPRIFDPFFTTKDVGKGSGLGLFIVHEIIEENDGCIAVNSEPGKGTTFFISLPIKG
jgi:signal transduction histidine kinase